MAKVIRFPGKRKDDPEILKLLELSNRIDEVLVDALQDPDLKPRDVAGVLAHRLGTVMRQIDEKNKLWDVCQKVLKKQAAIE